MWVQLNRMGVAMGERTRIAWCDATWNPVTGCTPISPACDHCYAMRQGARLRAMGSAGYATFPAVTCRPERLGDPGRWQRPRRILVPSMGDLFHKQVPQAFIQQVFAAMAAAPQHRFLVLTKRPARILGALYGSGTFTRGAGLPHVWLMVTGEDARRLGRRALELAESVARSGYPWHTGLSAEPLLGPLAEGLDLDRTVKMFEWVIAGGENGPSARPMGAAWVGDLAAACERAGVPFFFKGPGTAFQGALWAAITRQDVPPELAGFGPAGGA